MVTTYFEIGRMIVEEEQKGQIIEKSQDLIKDPYILEFIGLPEQSSYSENELDWKKNYVKKIKERRKL